MKGQIEKRLEDNSSLSKSTETGEHFCTKHKVHGGEKWERC